MKIFTENAAIDQCGTPPLLTAMITLGATGAAWAQDATPPSSAPGTATTTAQESAKFLEVVSATNAVIYLLIAAVVAWAFASALSNLMVKAGYPPNNARVGCWLGGVGWIIALLAWAFFYSAPAPWPIWVSLMVLGLIIGIVLLFTAKRPA